MSNSFEKFIQQISKGAVKYSDPRKLDIKIIDCKIRKTIKIINQSNWCWTIWSCQGHIHKDGAITLPYFTFIIKKKYSSKFFEILSDILPDYKCKKFPVVPNARIEISKGFSNKKYCIVNVHFSKYFVTNRVLHKNFCKQSLVLSREIRNFDGK